MKKFLTASLLGVGIMTLGNLGYAQNMPSNSEKSTSGIDNKGSPQRVTGEVTAVDTKSGKLSIKTAKQELELKVQGGTTKKSLDSIKVGDRVSVFYREQGADMVADSITKASKSWDSSNPASQSKKPNS